MNTITVERLLREGTEILGADCRIEVELLLGHVLGYNRAKLLACNVDELNDEQVKQFRDLVEQRRQGEPLQYLTGRTSFMGLEYKVSPAVLIPRFDTEILVEEAIALGKKMGDGITILDLCTGSGTIAVSLAKFLPKAKVYASDLSPEALKIANENAKLNDVEIEFRQGDLLKPFSKGCNQMFDMIASNPPYITSDEFKALPVDVRKEPAMALWGGEDGLKFYRQLAEECGGYLKKQGILILEVGHTQGPAVKELLEQNGYQQVRILKDWQQLDRVVLGVK